MIIKKILAMLMVIAILFSIGGCGSVIAKKSDVVSVMSTKTSTGFQENTKPSTKKDGTKYRISYVDIDPYPITGAFLYYTIQSLVDDGWIQLKGDIPFDPQNTDAKQLIEWLANQDIGPYMEFNKDTCYYIGVQDTNDVHASMIKHYVTDKDVDLIITMGTAPSLLVKSLNLNIPVIGDGMIDPIGSKFIDSSKDSGNDYLWAWVDPLSFKRQMDYYYSIFNFKKVGIIYYDEQIAAIPEYRQSAKANNFQLVEKKIVTDKSKTEAFKAEFNKKLMTLINDDHIDGFLLTTNMLANGEDAKSAFEILKEHKIPAVVQIGDGYVEDGGVMLVQPKDSKGSGPFKAYTIEAILNGAKPRDLPQEYSSSPYLDINLSTAYAIGFKPTFDMLLSSEKIY